MNLDNLHIEPDNSYHQPSTDPTSGIKAIVVVMTVLFMVFTSVLAIFFYDKKQKEGDVINASNAGNINQGLVVATPTPTPIPAMSDMQNPLLYPATASCVATIGVIDDSLSPSSRGITQSVFGTEAIGTLSSFSRANPIQFYDPLYYAAVPGIFTFRGNNFRNCATFGYVSGVQGAPTLTQAWEFSGIGTRLASTMNFEWSGVAWTGQPLVIEWSAAERATMNLYPEKASKEGLTEVIVAALDGKIYFFDIDDGSFTRDPIDVGCSIKGTPALDPRGYPLIYVGQCDDNASDDNFGLYIYSLIDGQELYHCSGLDSRAYRANWGAFDSSPIIDAATDTLIWPGENGIIYTFTLNTQYVAGTGTISVNPEMVGYVYIYNDSQGAYMGIESSISVYGGYGYFVDNAHNLNCIDLNTMQMVWTFKLGDDSDLTPAIEEENGVPYLYVGTEVDEQGEVVGEYNGAAYIYKINGLTGEIVWQTSVPCYTYNGESSDSDQTGGCLGNPVIGKRRLSNLVFFSFSMTNGLTSGNRIVAFNKETGIEEWSYNMNIYSYSSPIDCYDEEGNGYIIIADSIGQIHIIDGATGTGSAIQISRLTGTSQETTSGIIFDASPVIFGNTLIIGSKSGSVFAVTIG